MNGEFKRNLYKCKTRDTAFINYRVIKKDNETVSFPRGYVNSHGIKPVEYMMYLVKEKEEGDVNRQIRDRFGRFNEEKPLFGEWTILASEPYNIEETFWVYGQDSRLDFTGISKLVMKGAYSSFKLKQVIVVYNKLIIHNEDTFEMIICKCREDAQRLNRALHKAAKKSRTKSLLFMGIATQATCEYMYGLIEEETGWPNRKIRRTSTRP